MICILDIWNCFVFRLFVFGIICIWNKDTQQLFTNSDYDEMALYYVKSILTEISASRQDRRVLQKKQNHQNRISEQMGHATDF